MRKAGLSIGRGEAVGFFVLAYGGGGLARCFGRGDFDGSFAYSGFVCTMTIVGVSFRTGLRG